MIADEAPSPRQPASPRDIWALIGVETLCALGSEIARFGVSVWIYEATQSVYAFSALLFANAVPGLLVAPLAGHLVDRQSRKRVMIGASIVELCGTLLVLATAAFGHLSLIPILIGAAIASIGEAFQWPALSATVPLMATEDDLPRYNGFLESGRAASTLAGPIVGGATFALLGLKGLLSIELSTFLVAMAVVSTLAIPTPTEEEADEEEEETSLPAILFGFGWIYQHKALFKLLCVAVFVNFFLSVGMVLMTPYCLGILSEKGYGIVSGVFGGGMIVGGLLYGPLAGRFKNAHIFIVSALGMGVLYAAYGFARDLPSLAVLEFCLAILITTCNSAALTIWQLKVPEEYAGRVLSAAWMLAECTGPVAYLLAGPLGDSLVPYLLGRPNGIAQWVARTWGSSQSGQLGSVFSTIGLMVCVGFGVAACVKDIRNVEDAPV